MGNNSSKTGEVYYDLSDVKYPHGKRKPYRFKTNAELRKAVLEYDNPKTHYLAVVTYGNISNWDVSRIDDFTGIFRDVDCSSDISRWNVHKAYTMDSMFKNSTFNGDISKWDVSNVEIADHMFENSSFNGDISEWDFGSLVSSVDICKNSHFTWCDN